MDPTEPDPAATGAPATGGAQAGAVEAAPEAADAPQPDESMLGEAGESCRARSDCKSGLKCIEATCRDEREGTTCQTSADCGALRCIGNTCTSGLGGGSSNGDGSDGSAGEGSAGDDGPDAGDEWLAFKFGEGTHPFAGISMAGGPAEIYAYGGFASGQTAGVEGSFAFEFYGGVMFDRFELAAHFSPVAWKFYDVPGVGTQLSLRVTAGGYLPITDMVSWVLRGGFGFAAVDTPIPDDIFPVVQADLVGVAIHVGHLNIEINAPSYRMGIAPDAEVLIMNWHFGTKIGYVF